MFKQRRHHRKFGAPEVLAMAVAGLVVVAATSWWRENTVPSYRDTDGFITKADSVLMHYNATNLLRKISCDYEYHTEGGVYTGHWEGLWPEIGSPNSLPADQLDRIQKGFMVHVRYNRFDPAISTIHPIEGGLPRMQSGMALAACLLAIVYCLWVYPMLRKRS